MSGAKSSGFGAKCTTNLASQSSEYSPAAGPSAESGRRDIRSFMRAGGSPRRAIGSSSAVPDGAEGSGTSRVVIDDRDGAVGVVGGVNGHVDGGVAGGSAVHVDDDMVHVGGAVAVRKRRRLRRACADDDPTRDDGADRDAAGWGSDLSGGDTDGDFESEEEEEAVEGSEDESWEGSEVDEYSR